MKKIISASIFAEIVKTDYSRNIRSRQGSINPTNTKVEIAATAALSTNYTVKTYEILSSKVTLPFRVCSIADLHLGQDPLTNNAAIIGLTRIIASYKPDVVVIPGDLTNYNFCINDETKELFRTMAAACQNQVYASIGNGDCYDKNRQYQFNSKLFHQYKVICDLLHINFLDNQTASIKGLNLSITGLNRYAQDSDLEARVLNSLGDNMINLIMCHDPNHVDEQIFHSYRTRPQAIDLITSGHMHGGSKDYGIINGLDIISGQTIFRRLPGKLGQTSNDIFFKLMKKALRFNLEKGFLRYRNIFPHIQGLDHSWGITEAPLLNIEPGIVKRAVPSSKQGLTIFDFKKG